MRHATWLLQRVRMLAQTNRRQMMLLQALRRRRKEAVALKQAIDQLANRAGQAEARLIRMSVRTEAAELAMREFVRAGTDPNVLRLHHVIGTHPGCSDAALAAAAAAEIKRWGSSDASAGDPVAARQRQVLVANAFTTLRRYRLSAGTAPIG